MPESTEGYEESYSEPAFWKKCAGALQSAGAEVIEHALWLFYALRRPETPLWAKTTILAALGYFISPIDAIHDAVPVLGFTDDLGVLAAAVGAVSRYIDDEVRRLASGQLKRWGLS